MPPRLTLTLKALAQLGPQPVALNALYRFGLLTGHLRRQTLPGSPPEPPAGELQPVLRLPDPSAQRAALGEALPTLLAEADEIAGGKVRLFGGEPVPLVLTPPAGLQPLQHWTAYERRKSHWLAGADIKMIWEPARFGWAFILARAYHATREDGYAQAFWEHTERFLAANPTNLGPNWSSAQEVALRLVALVFAGQVLAAAPSSTPTRRASLASAVAAHARRIPPTLVYARSQQNNHLLVEAAGLFTAGLALPQHPSSAAWRRLGWAWFHRGLQAQIAPDGVYAQHSTNYHRLMLQAALWMQAVASQAGQPFPALSTGRLAAAKDWLFALTDLPGGHVPNLGANDGAYIFPMAVGDFADYRPVLQAAGVAFHDQPRRMMGIQAVNTGDSQKGETASSPSPSPLPRGEGKSLLLSGPWDEAVLWFVPEIDLMNRDGRLSSIDSRLSPLDSQTGSHKSWASLRAVRFTSRPSHADQLHVELWWQGVNLAQDAGTYLYNAAPPWDNALAGTAFHNTVMVDGQDQMTRAGRFLWLDWAQAEVLERLLAPDGSLLRIVARHNGYRRLGVIHERTLERLPSEVQQAPGRASQPVEGDDRLSEIDHIAESASPPATPSAPSPESPGASPASHGEEDHSAAMRSQTPGFSGSAPSNEIWRVTDRLLPTSPAAASAPREPHTARLHWLLPDAPWRLEGNTLTLALPPGLAHLTIQAAGHEPRLRLIRAGESLAGGGPPEPLAGWYSPTYAVRLPALALIAELTAPLPIQLTSTWVLEEQRSIP